MSDHLTDERLKEIESTWGRGGWIEQRHVYKLIAQAREANRLREQFKQQPCGHPVACVGKVRDDDEPHCLWCGDIADLHTLSEHVSTIYEHVTGGRITKPMTLPSLVVAIADDLETARTREAVKEEMEDLQEQLAAAEARADKESRNFDQYLRGLAENVGCDMAEYDLPSAHGNERLRWASLIALKMEPPAATIAKVVNWLQSEEKRLRDMGDHLADIGAGCTAHIRAKLESGEWAKGEQC